MAPPSEPFEVPSMSVTMTVPDGVPSEVHSS